MSKKQPIPFGKYLLLDRVNIGGMAEVWKAKTFGAEGFEKLVAIKRILPNIAEDEEFIAMFIDEAKISVQLTHANVAQVFDLGKIGDSYYIAMEYVSGKDLRAIFDKARKRGEPAPIPLVCYALSKAAEGLDYAHRKRDAQGGELNIVHRDVSPQNILCSFDGETKVIDFGIAKAANKATKTQAGILKGKFGYMSPEQVRGLPLDRRSDVFALGVVLYEMLTGERLFVGESDFSVLEKVRAVDILPPTTYNRRIPPALEKIVLKSLAKDVEDRFQYASELGDELQRFLITSDTIFSRKDLMQFMKSTFAEDVEREKMKLAEYSEIKLPPGMAALAGVAAPAAPAAPPRTMSQPNIPANPPPAADPTMDSATVIGVEGAAAPPAARPPPPSTGPRPSGIRPAVPAPPTTPASSRPGVPGPPVAPVGRPPGARGNTGQIPAVGAPVGQRMTSSGMGALKGPPPAPPRAAPPVAPPPVFEPDPEPEENSFSDDIGGAIDDNLADGDDEQTITPKKPRRRPEARPDTAENSAVTGGRSKLPLMLGVAAAVLVVGALGAGAFLMLGKSTGTLLVNSTPSDNLVILLDGEPVGNSTPYMNPKVAVGQHVLEITSRGYEITKKIVTINKQDTDTEELTLKKKGSSDDGRAAMVAAAIVRATGGAEVLLDGKVVIAKDAKGAAFTGSVDGSKEHVVEARLDGYKPFSRTVPAGEPINITAELEKN